MIMDWEMLKDEAAGALSEIRGVAALLVCVASAENDGGLAIRNLGDGLAALASRLNRCADDLEGVFEELDRIPVDFVGDR